MADAVAKTSTPDAAAGNPIDITTVTTGAGTVDRQCVSIGDPAANNRVAVTAAGAFPINQGVPASNVSAWPVFLALSGNSSIGSVTVLNLPSTQTVSGTVAVNQGIPASNVSAWPVFLALSGNSSIGSVNVERWLGSTAPTVGQKTAANSIPIVLPSDVTGAVTVSGALPSGANSIGTVFAQLLGATTSIGSVVLLGGTNSVGTVNAQGMAASGVAVAGNPLLNGLRAATTIPTVVANAQAVAWQGDIGGRGIVARSPLALVGKGNATLTSRTTAQLLAATSAVSWAIGTVYAASSQSTSAVNVDFFDNTTLITSIAFMPGITGGSYSQAIYFDPPWVCASGNSVNVRSSVSVTDIRVAITAYQTNG